MSKRITADALKTTLELLLLVVGTLIALQQCRLADSQTRLTEQMTRTSDLDRYDRLVEKVRARAAEAQEHYQTVHELRMQLDRATPTQATEIAFAVTNMDLTVHDESHLSQQIEPFLAESEQKYLHELPAVIQKANDAGRALVSRGAGPITVRAYHETQRLRREHPPQDPASLYESLGPGSLRFKPEEINTFPATEPERAALYRQLLAYEKVAEEKALAVLALETALTLSILHESE